MTSTLRRRVAVLLVWVLAVTGSAAAYSACRHQDDKPDAAMSAAMHAGHGAQHSAADKPADARDIGAGCDCGCTCTGNCNHVCHTTVLPPPVTAAIHLTAITLPLGAGDIAVNPVTSPPLRPPT